MCAGQAGLAWLGSCRSTVLGWGTVVELARGWGTGLAARSCSASAKLREQRHL